MINTWENMSPKDGYIVLMDEKVTNDDIERLDYLYQPVMGVIASGLFSLLKGEASQNPQLSNRKMHSELLALLNIDLPMFYEARSALEALGLLKSFEKEDALGKVVVYQLRRPLQAADFFTDDLLSILLWESIGDSRYQAITARFALPVLKLDGFKETSKSFLDVFQVNQAHLSDKPDIIAESKKAFSTNKKAPQKLVETSAIESFDFKFFIELLEKSFVSLDKINEQRDLIISEHLLYGIDEIEMAQFIGDSADLSTNEVDYNIFKQHIAHKYNQQIKLKKQAESKNEDSKKIKTKSVETLKKAGFSKEDSQLILASEAYNPFDFLKSLKESKGGYVTDSESYLLQQLVQRQIFSNAVINILSHYILIDRDLATLNKSFVDTMANDWSQQKVKTPEDAINQVRQFNTKKTETKVSNQRQRKIIKKETLPDWAKDDYQAPEVDVKIDKAELQRQLAEFNKTAPKGG
ncbi:replication initiation and membrane attachment family protein [Dellaglioa sp. L3N]